MATIETKVSDLSGATENVNTYTFGIDETLYEVDLTEEEYKKLADSLAAYITAGRRTSAVSSIAKPRTGARRDPAQTRAMKDWLRANGYEVPARGRISKELEDAYNTQTPATETKNNND